MKKLFVGLVCFCCAFTSVIANDEIINAYEIEPFDQHVSDDLIQPLVEANENEEDTLFISQSDIDCHVKLQQVSHIFQEGNTPFTPLVRKATFEGPDVELGLYQLETNEKFRLLNLMYGYRHR
ncbi:hypothetical protein Pan241w_45570 [Gimesia alba]|uniref:Uncharacterized protein n=1 Tax=Gimesia alba TaxID=2527973 RepID=A0A517RKQ2_9PLAN|nr:hypothetical protein [Gimesia alba]QDT44448.1 hypothetical protein Pan241w_45570 [Gimesia alba]